jgi:hypothetical protein
MINSQTWELYSRDHIDGKNSTVQFFQVKISKTANSTNFHGVRVKHEHSESTLKIHLLSTLSCQVTRLKLERGLIYELVW